MYINAKLCGLLPPKKKNYVMFKLLKERCLKIFSINMINMINMIHCMNNVTKTKPGSTENQM